MKGNKQMRIFFQVVALAVSLLSVTSNSALAWVTNVEGPDVFGNTKVTISSGELSENLVVQCDQKEELSLAYIFQKKEFQKIPETAATLYIQTGKEPPIKLEATVRGWNKDYAGVVASGRTFEIMGVIKAIGAAKGRIQIGVEAHGNRMSGSVNSHGSTKAIKILIKTCKLTNPK
jgi:hypothetical protein